MKQAWHIFLIFLFLIGCSEDNPEVISSEEVIELEVLELVNEHRTSQDLDVLTYHDDIAIIALSHSRNMASGNLDFGHEGFDDRFDLLRQQLNATVAGENVAFGYETAEEVMNGWINSTGHRENIEGDFNVMGLGIAEDESGQKYFTQIFAKI